MDADRRRALTRRGLADRALPLLAAIVLLLTGCSPTNPPTSGPRLIIATGVPEAMAGVGYGGTVGIDADGCVVLGKDAVLLAPKGSTLHGDVVTLRLGGNQTVTVRIGEQTDQLGGMDVGTFSGWVPPGTHCSSTKYILLG